MAVSGLINKETLPEPGKRNILITSALPYVNNVPHLGNIIGSVLLADVFSRFCKAPGISTLFVCGTDEYGTVTESKALEDGVTPQELCDKYHAIHKEIYQWFNIDFDIFGRTPTQQQTDITQDMFRKLHKKGFLEERVTTQCFCEKHQRFLADRFVEGDCPYCGYSDARGDQCDKCGKLVDPWDLGRPRCKLDGATPILKETKHQFLLLDKLQSKVSQFVIDSSKDGRWSENGVDITNTWLKEGLRARSITRDYKWGTPVPLPGYEDKVFYVWFDACIGYVSITTNYTEQWEKWWRDPDNASLYQFMGKDNVPFHAVMFPSTQIGSGDKWTKAHHLSVTEYLRYEGARETGVPSDVWRYFLLSHRPETSDSEFGWSAFIESNNNHLLKNLGNFVNRIIKFVNSPNYNSVVPDYTKPAAETSFDSFRTNVNHFLKRYLINMEAVKLHAALTDVLHISSEGNTLLQSNTLDNKLFAENAGKCAAVVGLALNLVHLLASVIEPYMPETSTSILRQLNTEMRIIPDEWAADSIKPGHKIGKAVYLFTQIKPEKEHEWREAFGGDEARKAKEKRAALVATRKAEKAKKKNKAAVEQNTNIHSVEAADKNDTQKLIEPLDVVDKVTEGSRHTNLERPKVEDFI